MVPFLFGEGVVVVAVSIYIIWIEFKTILLCLDLKIAAACGIGIALTRSVPIRLDLRIDKGTVQEILDLVPKDRREFHNSITDHHPFEVYRRGSV